LHQPAEPSDNAGWSVAIDGNTAMVGAYRRRIGGFDQAGVTQVFRRVATWSLDPVFTISANDRAEGEWFGFAVALDGATALNAAFSDDNGGNIDQGSAYMHNRGVDPSSWNEQQKLTADTAAQDALFRNGFE